MKRTSLNANTVKRDKEREVLSDAIALLPHDRQRAVVRVANGKCSQWLTAPPATSHHFDLSPIEFRDAIGLRYKLPLPDLPTHCDGCGAECDTDHLLNCKVGGLVVRRHNEVRDTLGDLLSVALGRQVILSRFLSSRAMKMRG
eukprot:GHVN01102707.1.p1 GENE.GHVN01102707.1~~GHVN01102707.1.p1  ORF type:complete len:143 (+),score=19.92 GHVN01102707.1:388-816(+)